MQEILLVQVEELRHADLPRIQRSQSVLDADIVQRWPAEVDIARLMALGADWCNSARGFMFALGCLQARFRCRIADLCGPGPADAGGRSNVDDSPRALGERRRYP